jgi:hypothetical protein
MTHTIEQTFASMSLESEVTPLANADNDIDVYDEDDDYFGLKEGISLSQMMRERKEMADRLSQMMRECAPLTLEQLRNHANVGLEFSCVIEYDNYFIGVIGNTVRLAIEKCYFDFCFENGKTWPLMPGHTYKVRLSPAIGTIRAQQPGTYHPTVINFVINDDDEDNVWYFPVEALVCWSFVI